MPRKTPMPIAVFISIKLYFKNAKSGQCSGLIATAGLIESIRAISVLFPARIISVVPMTAGTAPIPGI